MINWIKSIERYPVTPTKTILFLSAAVCVAVALKRIEVQAALMKMKINLSERSIVLLSSAAGGLVAIFAMYLLFKPSRQKSQYQTINPSSPANAFVKKNARELHLKEEVIKKRLEEQYDSCIILPKNQPHNISWFFATCNEILNYPLDKFNELTEDTLGILIDRLDFKPLRMKEADSPPSEKEVPPKPETFLDFLMASRETLLHWKDSIPPSLFAFTPTNRFYELQNDLPQLSEQQLKSLFFFNLHLDKTKGNQDKIRGFFRQLKDPETKQEDGTEMKPSPIEIINFLLDTLNPNVLLLIPKRYLKNEKLKLSKKHAFYINQYNQRSFHTHVFRDLFIYLDEQQIKNLLNLPLDYQSPSKSLIYSEFRKININALNLRSLSHFHLDVIFNDVFIGRKRLRSLNLEDFKAIAPRLSGYILHECSEKQFRNIPFPSLSKEQIQILFPLFGLQSIYYDDEDWDILPSKELTTQRFRMLTKQNVNAIRKHLSTEHLTILQSSLSSSPDP